LPRKSQKKLQGQVCKLGLYSARYPSVSRVQTESKNPTGFWVRDFGSSQGENYVGKSVLLKEK
jgi:hypothetical protein